MGRKPIYQTTNQKGFSRGEKIEIIFLTGIGLILVALGYYYNEMDLQQWGIISIIVAFLFILTYREFIRSTVILPGHESEAYSLVVELLGNSQEFMKLIDLYPGESTIRAIAAVPEGISIQWLTMKLNNKKKQASFEAVTHKILENRKDIQIRYAPRGELHDRLILTKPHGWALGQSIKDIGNKLGVIHPISGSDTDKAIVVFENVWTESESFQ